MNLMTASRQWASRPRDERYDSLDRLIAALEDRRERSAEHVDRVERHRIEHDDRGELYLAGENGRWQFTNWSFSQLCDRLGAPQWFVSELNPDTAARVLNELMNDGEENKLMTVRGRGAAPDVLQAITSPRYGRIWDADVARAVKRIAEMDSRWHNPMARDIITGNAEPGGLYTGDRDVFIFMIDGGSDYDVGPRALLNRGFFVRNSEVGNARLELTTFLFNRVCGNHIIYGARDIKSVIIWHNSTGPNRYRSEFAPALEAFTARDPDLGAIKRAQTIRLLDLPGVGHHEHIDDDWKRDFARAFKFTRKETNAAFDAALREEGRCYYLWDVVQGLTEVARGIPFQDRRLDLEVRAAELLNIANN